MDSEYNIVNVFDLDTALLPPATNNTERFEALRKLLIERIEEMAFYNLEHLMWLLYKIDVSEQKLKDELTKHPPSAFATVIADAIIQRETEKAAMRKKFSRGGDDWQFDL